MKLFVRDLTVIDSSYLCERRGMVGESWLVDIEMSGELSEMSMLLDFGRVKKLIKSIIDEEVDHKLLVPTESALGTSTPWITTSAPWICCVRAAPSTCAVRARASPSFPHPRWIKSR